ncbi:MAG: ArsB/NhaD family transporter [Candidatus Humimicrobiaceae bacterium]
MNTTIISLIIFILTYIVIATEKVNRTVVAFLGALLLLVFKVFNLEQAVGYISWETIGLLFGMFLIVSALSDSGLFSYLALKVARLLKYSPTKLFIVFPIITFVLSGFMDSITVMLFFAALTFELCKLLKIDPVPLVITEVVLANTGGAATLVGDPPNVILGLKLGFFFNDFVIHNGPITIIAGAAALAYCFLVNRKKLKPAEHISKAELDKLDPAEAITDKRELKIALAAFGVAIIFLITHIYIEKYLHIPLTVPLASMLPAFIMLVVLGKKSEVVINKVDFEVILFFIGLFVVVGGLEHTGVIKTMADFITNIFQNNHIGLLSALLWGSGVASGVVDNVPFALSMAYVLADIAKVAVAPALAIMVWATSLGTDIGGNFTPIGASANVVAYTAMEKKGTVIGWGRWIKLAAPATFIALVVCNILIYVKYLIGWY